jgi:neutral ceramidase
VLFRSTVYRARNHKASGDYPGAVQEMIEGRYGGVCLFAIGPVGSMGPAQEELPPPERGRRLAEIISGRVEGIFSSAAAPRTVARLGSAIVEADLPVLQFRVSQGWRLSPVVSPLIHSRRTYVHAVRINDLVLLGMPADYSGELADWMEKVGDYWTRRFCVVVTSFNGDYIGYLLPPERYSFGFYEGQMAFFGPGCGEYFGQIARRIIYVWARNGSDAAPRADEAPYRGRAAGAPAN